MRKGGRERSKGRTSSRPHASGEVGVLEAVALAAIVIEIPEVVHGHRLACYTREGGKEGGRRGEGNDRSSVFSPSAFSSLLNVAAQGGRGEGKRQGKEGRKEGSEERGSGGRDGGRKGERTGRTFHGKEIGLLGPALGLEEGVRLAQELLGALVLREGGREGGREERREGGREGKLE